VLSANRARIATGDPLPAGLLRIGAALLRRTQPLADAVELRLDRAAAAVAGPSAAARALAKAQVIDTDFQATVHDLWSRLPDDWDDVGIVDVYDAWQTRLRHGRMVPWSWYAAKLAALPARHPTLASLIGALSPGDLELTEPADPIAVASFDKADQIRLAACASFVAPTRWMMLAEIPPQAWEAAIRFEGDEVVTQVTKILRRAPDSAGEVIDVAATRMAEFFAVAGNRRPPDPDEIQDEAERAVLAFAEDRLDRRGWRRRHPAIEGLLVGPDSAELDILPLARRCLTSDAARSELATLVAA
jgi:hypothetical protein